MNKLVSVIILNWNGAKYLNQCVNSVVNQSHENIEIILVDNNSIDGSFEKAVTTFNFNITIKNIENYGFAKGMNIGINNASGDFIMTLNMDVYLAPNAIENAIKSFKNFPDVGIIMGKEFSWQNENFIDKETNSSGPGFLKIRGQGFFLKKRINEATFSFGAMGSFPIFRKKVLEDLKKTTGYFFDPKFETGWEDKDIFFRCHHLGWKFLYNPKIIGYHSVSGSVNNKSRLIDKSLEYQQRIFRNRYYFIYKNYPTKLLILIFPFLLLVEIILYPYYFFKNPKSLVPLLKGQIEFSRNFKFIYSDRKKILNNSKLSTKEIFVFFKKL